MHAQDARIRRLPTRLPGEIWGVTSYFNPAQTPRYLHNLVEFSAGVRAQGLNLLVVELAFHEQPFQLSHDIADRLVRRRADSRLWQKERLLNIGIAELPPGCDKVVWLDGDLVFDHSDWVRETAALLDAYAIVQPFSRALWLTENPSDVSSEPAQGLGDGHWMPSMAAVMSQQQHWRYTLADYFRHGHCGFAWAGRRAILAQHGLYDRHILGGGDVTLAHAFYGDTDYWRGRNYWCRQFTRPEMSAIATWSHAIHSDVQTSVAVVPGQVRHLWHGQLATRGYQERYRILHDNQFDPVTDVTLDAQGCLTWNSQKPDLHRRVAAYLTGRGQDVGLKS